jgi:amidophosphoribosyltransferase
MKEKYIFNPLLKRFIKGKRVVLPDDSIVRGDTLEYVVPAFRDFYEPSEIHLRIPSPAVVAPCFYGINLAKTNELVAPRFFKDIKNPTSEELKALASHFGATSLRYLTIPQLIDALQMHVKSVCLGCVTGDYPTPC